MVIACWGGIAKLERRKSVGISIGPGRAAQKYHPADSGFLGYAGQGEV